MVSMNKTPIDLVLATCTKLLEQHKELKNKITTMDESFNDSLKNVIEIQKTQASSQLEFMNIFMEHKQSIDERIIDQGNSLKTLIQVLAELSAQTKANTTAIATLSSDVSESHNAINEVTETAKQQQEVVSLIKREITRMRASNAKLSQDVENANKSLIQVSDDLIATNTRLEAANLQLESATTITESQLSQEYATLEAQLKELEISKQ